ncbi:integral membrane protein [Diaporthe helianthi]|uniref:Integral membrane protein n=1 Tax=Diaporthe helianthi TaxID=158607 RepID=A0A2P5HLX3_DIAHE|nr:integral membrane protein [Diaporthe helianthi]
MSQTDQQRQDSLVILSIILTTLSVFIVAARSLIRFVIIRKPGWDEYTILMALFFTIGYMVEILILRANHVGFPASTLTTDNMLHILQTTLAIEVTYYLIIGFIKTSILCMYLRFAVSEIFRYLCYGTIVFQMVFTVICLCVTLGQCQPLRKMWDLIGTQPGFCINATAFFYTTSGVNILTDFWIIALPIKTLNGLNRPLKEKIALALILGAGIFAAIMSVVRLQSIYIFTLATDPFRDAIAVNLFSQIEINTAILCASVPALKPLFTPHRLQEFKNGRKYQHRPHDKIDSENQRTISSRKRSHPELYPDAFDLTKISALDRSSKASVGGGIDTREMVFNKVWLPPRSKIDDAEDEVTFDLPNQKAFHPV